MKYGTSGSTPFTYNNFTTDWSILQQLAGINDGMNFDASALLDLYRMTRTTREEFLSILDRLKDRVWLPHQTGLEYYDNRPA